MAAALQAVAAGDTDGQPASGFQSGTATPAEREPVVSGSRTAQLIAEAGGLPSASGSGSSTIASSLAGSVTPAEMDAEMEILPSASGSRLEGAVAPLPVDAVVGTQAASAVNSVVEKSVVAAEVAPDVEMVEAEAEAVVGSVI